MDELPILMYTTPEGAVKVKAVLKDETISFVGPEGATRVLCDANAVWWILTRKARKRGRSLQCRKYG